MNEARYYYIVPYSSIKFIFGVPAPVKRGESENNMSNTIDLNKFNGTVLAKTFTVPDRVLKNKKYVKFGLNCPAALYAILENGRIYIKTITSGQEYNGGM